MIIFYLHFIFILYERMFGTACGGCIQRTSFVRIEERIPMIVCLSAQRFSRV